MDPLPLLNFFSKHASEQATPGTNAWPLKGRIPSRSSPNVTQAFAAALDTLATLCVSRQTGQKVAMTVTIPRDNRVIITLSESTCGVQDTAEFLQQLWGALNTICMHRNPSPTGKVEKGHDVFVIVFRHGFLRLRQRIICAWDAAMKFYVHWEASTTKSGGESIHGRLTAVFDTLRAVLDSLPGAGTPTQAQTVDIVTQIHALYEHCKALSNAEATVQQWLNEYAHASAEPAVFPLRRYLRGCLAMYCKTVSLIDAATNVDFHDMFARTLHIKTLRPGISPLDYPLDKPFWESYLADIVDRCEITGTRTPKLRRALDEEVAHAIATAKEMKHGPLHCELRLLTHHQQQVLASPPEKEGELEAETATRPRNYIGTSEPPCYACGVFIDAYRRKSRGVFNFNPMYTQVPDPTLQVPWAMPKFGNAAVDRSIQRTVFIQFCLDYAMYIAHQFGFRRLSQ
ncbi:hypothetical protein BD410DRAFT_899690 [Rickenella mellea]|uniref:Uncharacterized protein n=1 Tax=Rickenella mellea TaxID=50990 RepID=A0A4Y7PZC3_9AGAM|nr:hypothetical protein BD410DRAFT_899690 [Rickenella mellea]